MRAAYDEVLAAGLRAQHAVQRIIGDCWLAQLATTAHARPPIAWGGALPGDEEPGEFDFTVSPVNQGLVRELHEGALSPPSATPC